jgi:hypothetical protein
MLQAQSPSRLTHANLALILLIPAHAVGAHRVSLRGPSLSMCSGSFLDRLGSNYNYDGDDSGRSNTAGR